MMDGAVPLFIDCKRAFEKWAIREKLLGPEDAVTRKIASNGGGSPTAAIIDSQSVKSAEKGGLLEEWKLAKSRCQR
jgi:hypothetical protein